MNNEATTQQCAAITRAGTQCKRQAQAGSDYCYLHQPAVAHKAAEPAGETITVAVESPAEKGGAADQIPIVEEEQDQRKLRRQLMAELDALITRVQALTPGYNPPPFSPRRLLDMVEQNLDRFSPADRLGILKRLRAAVNDDVLDVETWKGLWYMINYSLEYQADVFKRRFTGEYDTDEWGLDWEFMEAVRPFLSFLYNIYWRVEATGMENVPDGGRALLVSNHSGQLPWDSLMVGMAVMTQHPAQRLVRSLYSSWMASVPFLPAFLDKMGQAVSTVPNGIRLLEQDELVAVYPEGQKGLGKLFRDRYKLASFGRGGFIKAALKTSAPIIPVSVVGAEETYVSLVRSQILADAAGLPYFPISPTFPWLGLAGLIPLPTRWHIDFGDAIPMDSFEPGAAEHLPLVAELTEQVRGVVQEMVNKRLAERRSVFL
jgi:1-acyl-sn-glycerol-3-phosphate acyltransferase